LPEVAPRSYRTSFTGQDLTRIKIPCRRDRFTAKDGPDCNWPTPEPPHRINQIFLEPILFEHAAARVRSVPLRVLDVKKQPLPVSMAAAWFCPGPISTSRGAAIGYRPIRSP
jgi:hypothetical protein